MPEKTNVLLATTEDHIFQEISASLSKNHQIIRVKEGVKVLKTLIETAPILAVSYTHLTLPTILLV